MTTRRVASWKTGATLPRPWLWAALVGVGLLSSCTVPADGYAGVTVDSNGVVRALVQTCKHSVDGAILYWVDDPEGSDSRDAEIGSWRFSRSTVARPLSWPVDADRSEDVQPTVGVKTMARGRTYSLYGWTNDNSWSTDSVDFTLDDLKALLPGRVLVLYPGAQPREVSVEQFSDLACSGASP